MFRCDGCGSHTQPGTPSRRIPTQIAPSEYFEIRQDDRGRKFRVKTGDGWHVVLEGTFCPTCAITAEATHLAQVKALPPPVPLSISEFMKQTGDDPD